MDRKVLTLLSVFLLSLFCMNATAQVEYVFTSIVTDSATFMEALDDWYASNDSRAGQTATLFESVINGEDTSTHSTIIDFPDYASIESIMNRLPASEDFAKMQRRTAAISTTVWEGLSVRVMDNGKSWKKGDFLWALGVQVSRGENQAYEAAFKKYLNSKTVKQAPGLLRLVAPRAGSSSNYVVLVTAPTFVALNEFYDASGASDDYANFLSEVKDFSTASAPEIYRVVKVWK